MSHIQAEQRSIPDRVAHVEFVAANGHRFHTDAEQFAFHGIKQF